MGWVLLVLVVVLGLGWSVWRPAEPPRPTASIAGSGGDDAHPVRVVCLTWPAMALTMPLLADLPGVTLELLLPGDTGCPHDVVLSPGDLARLEDAEVVVAVGAGFEPFLTTGQLSVGGGRLVELASGEPLLPWRSPADYGHPPADDHEHGPGCAHAVGSASHGVHDDGCAAGDRTVNPHVFVSPCRLARMVARLAPELQRAVPGGAGAIASRAETLAARLRQLDARYLEQLGRLPATARRVVASHGILDYLAADYGLDIVGIMGEMGREAPSPTALADLAAMVRQTGARALLIESQFPHSVAQVLVAETGLPIVEIDPLVSGTGIPATDAASLAMESNLAAITGALAAPLLPAASAPVPLADSPPPAGR